MRSSMNRGGRAVAALVIVTTPGCYREEENAADVCVFPGDSPWTVDEAPDHDAQFVAGEALKISAAFHFGVTVKARDLSCTAIQDGDRIIIETTYEWKGHSGSDAIGTYFASCHTPALPAGTYVLDYGSEEKLLQIPGTSPVPCLSAD